MGIADRDYMRENNKPDPAPKKRKMERAQNQPKRIDRLRFFLWRLFNRR